MPGLMEYHSISRAKHSPYVAIIGGGLAGFAFALACQNVGLRFMLYESRPEAWQHSAGIGLSPNALHALGLIDTGLIAEVSNISSQAHQNANSHYRHGEDGPAYSALETFHVVPSGDAKTVLRSTFVELLASRVSSANVAFSKHLSTVCELPSERLQLSFQDGSSCVHDVVVGCDGIHSQVRRIMFGDDPRALPRFTGKVLHRGRVSAREVAATLGERVARGVSIVCGRGGHIVFVPIEGGQTFSLNAVASQESWESDRWTALKTGEDLRQSFRGWDIRILDLLERSGDSAVWALFDLPSVPSLIKGKIAIMGDAAHASTPFQGGGAAMALEDAYLLSHLLVEMPLDTALRAYDSARRPRVQRQVQTSLETGQMLAIEEGRPGRDHRVIQESMSNRFDWLWHFDLHKELNQLVTAFEHDGIP